MGDTESPDVQRYHMNDDSGEVTSTCGAQVSAMESESLETAEEITRKVEAMIQQDGCGESPIGGQHQEISSDHVSIVKNVTVLHEDHGLLNVVVQSTKIGEAVSLEGTAGPANGCNTTGIEADGAAVIEDVVTITVLEKDSEESTDVVGSDAVNEDKETPETTNEDASNGSFLIIGSNDTNSSLESETVDVKHNGDANVDPAANSVLAEGPQSSQINDECFKEIESLVAAFDGIEDGSEDVLIESAPVPEPKTEESLEIPSIKVESPKETPQRTKKSEQKIQRARRTGGPPVKREVVAEGADKQEIPSVVGNGKLRVHGYEKVNQSTGLPELVLVNREILERIISDQDQSVNKMRSKLKELYKVCDDLRKVVLTKGLNTVLSQEEAAVPVDVVIKMQKLPPHIPLCETGTTNPVAKDRKISSSTRAPKAASSTSKPPKSEPVKSIAPSLDVGENACVAAVDDSCELAQGIVDVLPKDILKALTNGDVLTQQQRQRFIDKITVDIMKAKGVPQPKQIQEIAMQVANMYPRSLVILPEGKRRSMLRKRKANSEEDEDSAAPKKQRNTKSEAGLDGNSTKKKGRAPKSRLSAPELPVTEDIPMADVQETPKAEDAPLPPPPSEEPGSSSSSQELKVVLSPSKQRSPTALAVKRKGGRQKKSAASKIVTPEEEEERSMSFEQQKEWLLGDVSKSDEDQDEEKQSRLLHNCYDYLYKEMAAKDYDCVSVTEEWPVLKKPVHVLSVFKRLKRVHGRFQDLMRRDAPKLVTFLHERVTSDEGAEWSMKISQAKLSERYQLPEEVGVVPLLALNFEEDFGLLFKLVSDETTLKEALEAVEPVPIIIGVGENIFNCDYHLVIERQLMYSPRTFLDAMELLFASYFVFNLAYPKELLNTLEYLQRYYVGYNPHIKMVTMVNTRPRIANFLKKLKDFERLDWNSNIRANSPGVPPEFERESDPEDEAAGPSGKAPATAKKEKTTDTPGEKIKIEEEAVNSTVESPQSSSQIVQSAEITEGVSSLYEKPVVVDERSDVTEAAIDGAAGPVDQTECDMETDSPQISSSDQVSDIPLVDEVSSIANCDSDQHLQTSKDPPAIPGQS